MANLNPNNMNVKQLTAVIKILDGKIKDAESAKDAPAARRLKNIQNKYITARSKIIAYVTAQQKKGIATNVLHLRRNHSDHVQSRTLDKLAMFHLYDGVDVLRHDR